MNSRLFNMLHNACYEDIFTITDRIDIDLDGIIEESVQQHRCVVHRVWGEEVVSQGARVDFAGMDGRTWVQQIGVGL